MWLLIAIVGHLLNGLAFLVDKFLLVKRVPSPAVYAFFVSVLGGLALLLLPFDPVLPQGQQWLLDFLAGATFFLALYFFFAGLARGEASRVVPFVGGLIPLATLVLARLFLHEQLREEQWIAVIILVVAVVLLARDSSITKPTSRSRAAYAFGLAAAVLFAVSSVLMKLVFIEQSFVAGFVWTRVGAAVCALGWLVVPGFRASLRRVTSQPTSAHNTRGLFFLGQVAGAVGFLLLQYAIALGSVTLVNALQGLQYAFLFAGTFILSHLHPKILQESWSRPAVIHKLVGLGLTIGGLILLSY